MYRVMLASLLAATLVFAGCGEASDSSAPSSSSAPAGSASADSGSWETARQNQDDPDSIKSADDIAGNCVKDIGTGAQICGTAAMDYCVGGLAPAEAQEACVVIVADALKPKN